MANNYSYLAFGIDFNRLKIIISNKPSMRCASTTNAPDIAILFLRLWIDWQNSKIKQLISIPLNNCRVHRTKAIEIKRKIFSGTWFELKSEVMDEVRPDAMHLQPSYLEKKDKYYPVLCVLDDYETKLLGVDGLLESFNNDCIFFTCFTNEHFCFHNALYFTNSK